ncbi:hypothetical protein [Ureaplasma diversum]|uniref:Lipoprotein n=1 Tax=Ureaplasma diversum NCTC 246 TaxID=1188241 RepID=A0A084EWI8_9BACT|nr:hypothetical protein [Ureaplasma diversum]KEZ22330.1 Hypothetical protein, predicted lipoprotein,DUF1410 family [Ureaplasma diversum NCTC 246]
MKIKRKGIFAFASIGIVAITTTLIASCARSTNPTLKSELNLEIVEKVLRPTNNQKYGLKLKINKAYADHFVQVDLVKSTTNANSISSDKNKISSSGEVVVQFSNLDLDSKYLIKRVKVFKKINDQNPLINQEYKTKDLLNVHKVVNSSTPTENLNQNNNPDQSLNQKGESKLSSINKVFRDGIVYKKSNDSLEYKTAVDDEFNDKQLTLEVVNLDGNQSHHFDAISKDNLVAFDLSQLGSGNYQIKQLKDKEADKQLSINQIKFTHASTFTKPFIINSSGQTSLEVENSNIKKNEYYYAIFKDNNNSDDEYKVLTQAKEDNKLSFNVGVLTNKTYTLDRVESNEIDTLEKNRRVVVPNAQLDEKYKDSFQLSNADAKVANNKLELKTNNETINNYLSFSLPYETTDNKIFQKVLVAKFKDDLGTSLESTGSYEKDKFIFDTSKLSTNKLWTLTEFSIKEKELLNHSEKTLINKLELKTNKPAYVINNDISSTNLAIQSKIKTVDVNTNEDKSKTIKFYNTKLANQTVKLSLGNETDDQLVELTAKVNDGLIATFDLSKEDNLDNNKKYIIKKITDNTGRDIADVANLTDVEKYLYKNKFLISASVTHPLANRDFRDVQINVPGLDELITRDDRKYLTFVFEYQGQAMPNVTYKDDIVKWQIGINNLKNAKEHEKVEKEVKLINPQDNGLVVNLDIPLNRHYQLKRIELKRPNKTILLYKNDSQSYNITNGYGVNNILIKDNNLEVDLIADNEKKHINTSFTVYIKTPSNEVKKVNGQVSSTLNATGKILQHTISLSSIGFNLDGAKAIALSLNDEMHDKYNILNKEFELKKEN